jgi:nucleoside-diphosphate-sugar epimerase
MTPSWLIIGAGYTGGRLAAQLAASGATVVATRRAFPEGASEGAEAVPRPGAITTVALDLDGAPPQLPALPAGSIAVYCAPPGDPPGAREERLVRALAGFARIIYISSTGVYGPGYGQWIDEAWTPAPASESEKARLAAEQQLVRTADELGVPWTLLRPSGIYGPGRSLVARVRRGEARVVGDGSAYICRIHVDDLVAAIVAVAERQLGGVINASDDDPSPYGQVLDEVAGMLGLPPAPRIDPEAVSPMARAMLLANRKISNKRLREELGLTLRYPSWRVAVQEELESERAS